MARLLAATGQRARGGDRAPARHWTQVPTYAHADARAGGARGDGRPHRRRDRPAGRPTWSAIGSHVDGLLAFGELLFDAGRRRDAARVFARLLVVEPGAPGARYYEGALLADQHRYREAIDASGMQVIAAEPTGSSAHRGASRPADGEDLAHIFVDAQGLQRAGERHVRRRTMGGPANADRRPAARAEHSRRLPNARPEPEDGGASRDLRAARQRGHRACSIADESSRRASAAVPTPLGIMLVRAGRITEAELADAARRVQAAGDQRRLARSCWPSARSARASWSVRCASRSRRWSSSSCRGGTVLLVRGAGCQRCRRRGAGARLDRIAPHGRRAANRRVVAHGRPVPNARMSSRFCATVEEGHATLSRPAPERMGSAGGDRWIEDLRGIAWVPGRSEFDVAKWSTALPVDRRRRSHRSRAGHAAHRRARCPSTSRGLWLQRGSARVGSLGRRVGLCAAGDRCGTVGLRLASIAARALRRLSGSARLRRAAPGAELCRSFRTSGSSKAMRRSTEATSAPAVELGAVPTQRTTDSERHGRGSVRPSRRRTSPGFLEAYAVADEFSGGARNWREIRSKVFVPLADALRRCGQLDLARKVATRGAGEASARRRRA